MDRGVDPAPTPWHILRPEASDTGELRRRKRQLIDLLLQAQQLRIDQADTYTSRKRRHAQPESTQLEGSQQRPPSATDNATSTSQPSPAQQPPFIQGPGRKTDAVHACSDAFPGECRENAVPPCTSTHHAAVPAAPTRPAADGPAPALPSPSKDPETGAHMPPPPPPQLQPLPPPSVAGRVATPGHGCRHGKPSARGLRGQLGVSSQHGPCGTSQQTGGEVDMIPDTPCSPSPSGSPMQALVTPRGHMVTPGGGGGGDAVGKGGGQACLLSDPGQPRTRQAGSGSPCRSTVRLGGHGRHQMVAGGSTVAPPVGEHSPPGGAAQATECHGFSALTRMPCAGLAQPCPPWGEGGPGAVVRPPLAARSASCANVLSSPQQSGGGRQPQGACLDDPGPPLPGHVVGVTLPLTAVETELKPCGAATIPTAPTASSPAPVALQPELLIPDAEAATVQPVTVEPEVHAALNGVLLGQGPQTAAPEGRAASSPAIAVQRHDLHLPSTVWCLAGSADGGWVAAVLCPQPPNTSQAGAHAAAPGPSPSSQTCDRVRPGAGEGGKAPEPGLGSAGAIRNEPPATSRLRRRGRRGSQAGAPSQQQRRPELANGCPDEQPQQQHPAQPCSLHHQLLLFQAQLPSAAPPPNLDPAVAPPRGAAALRLASRLPLAVAPAPDFPTSGIRTPLAMFCPTDSVPPDLPPPSEAGCMSPMLGGADGPVPGPSPPAQLLIAVAAGLHTPDHGRPADQGQVRLLLADGAGWHLAQVLEAQSVMYAVAAVGMEGCALVGAGAGGHAALWQLSVRAPPPGQACQRLEVEVDSYFRLPQARVAGVPLEAIVALRPLPGSRHLVLGCTAGGAFALWDAQARQCLAALPYPDAAPASAMPAPACHPPVVLPFGLLEAALVQLRQAAAAAPPLGGEGGAPHRLGPHVEPCGAPIGATPYRVPAAATPGGHAQPARTPLPAAMHRDGAVAGGGATGPPPGSDSATFWQQCAGPASGAPLWAAWPTSGRGHAGVPGLSRIGRASRAAGPPELPTPAVTRTPAPTPADRDLPHSTGPRGSGFWSHGRGSYLATGWTPYTGAGTASPAYSALRQGVAIQWQHEVLSPENPLALLSARRSSMRIMLATRPASGTGPPQLSCSDEIPLPAACLASLDAWGGLCLAVSTEGGVTLWDTLTGAQLCALCEQNSEGQLCAPGHALFLGPCHAVVAAGKRLMLAAW